ncbi:MAG TPA: Crp/Fnr family transcriptional regulator [Thermoanaerobaculia bacterium]|nr:Crp/Fnr family transcriptional regulator [Thermoanaerobaculia bacterium]
MPSPYNLDIHNTCADCTVRTERLFCNMSPSSVSTMDSIKFTGIYPKGSLLFVEGEQPRGVFILCSGRAKLTTSSSEGKLLIVKIAEPGEVLGASATILGKPYEVSAETLEPSQLNFIKREDFLRFLTANAEVCMHTAQQLSEKYHSAQREIRSLGLSQTTGEKLAKLILDWCDQDGDETPKGVRLKVLLTHEEIAQMIGTTRETVTRLLSDMKRRKLIDVKGSTVLVLDKGELEHMVSI